MIVAIHQPNFLPWLGFFHKLKMSDVFVLFDDVQLPRGRSFCNRVAIRIGDESRWLTVPVLGKSKLPEIREVLIDEGQPWRRKHLQTLRAAYQKAPFFMPVFEALEDIYRSETPYLIDLNVSLIQLAINFMGIKTKLVKSSDLNIDYQNGGDHLLAIVKAIGANTYLTGEGQGSRRYVIEENFEKAGISVLYQNFKHPIYPQRGPGFIPNLSIIDLLFNEGLFAREVLMEEGWE